MFSGMLAGPGVTSANNFGIWVGRPGDVILAVRTGDTIDLDPGAGEDLRTVAEIIFRPDTLYADPSPFTGDRLIWQATFTDGSQAIIVTAIPEPGSVLAVCAAGVGVAGLVRRRRRGTAG